MKKIYVLFFTLFITVYASSQVELGFFAGPQATSVHYTILDVKQKSTFKYDFQVGMNMKVPFDVRLFFVPTAFYSLKGYKVTYNLFSYPPDANAKDNNTSINTFELAPLLQYDLGSKPAHCFIKAGPSLDLQLFGKETYNLKSGGSVSRNMPFSFDDYGHFAANILGQFGFESAGGFMIFAQYTHGIGNLDNFENGPTIHHRAYGISIGKYLNRKKIVIDTRNKE